MIKRQIALVATVLMFTASAALAAQPAKDALTLPISGTFTDALGGKGTFTGTFKLTDFSATATQLFANGYVSGTLTDSTGKPLGSAMKAVSIPASVAGGPGTVKKGSLSITTNATCDILGLVLGPLHLDLLGLTVDLNQVVLDIAANTGAGNLLGNLLCAVTNLLNGVGTFIDIANLLNQILQILTGVLG